MTSIERGIQAIEARPEEEPGESREQVIAQ